jgi:hypothetical protein
VKLQQDLKEFVKLLISHGVEFIVVGGHAVAFHGHPRFTGDIDFLLRPTHDNAERVMETLKAFGFTGLALTIDDLKQPEKVIQLGRSPNRIDLLTSISGVAFEEAWNTRLWSSAKWTMIGPENIKTPAPLSDFVEFDAPPRPIQHVSSLAHLIRSGNVKA